MLFLEFDNFSVFLTLAFLSDLFNFFLEISGELLFVGAHGFLSSLHFLGFFIDLLLDFDEDAHAFLALGFSFSDLGEGLTQRMAELIQVLSQLQLVIEGDHIVTVVNRHSDETLAIAIIDELLDLGPGAVEAKMFV